MSTDYINVNTFDYDKLLARIVKHAELGDTEISNIVITNIFKELATAFNNKGKRDQMSQEEVKVAETFLKEFSGLRYADYDDESATEFFAAAAETMDWALQNFQEFLTGTISQDEVSDETMAFYMALLDLMDVESFLGDDNDGEQAIITMERLQDILDDYMTGEFTEVQLAILSEMEKLLSSSEIITHITVEDRPGKKVKYGDSLVTLPTIIMEATHSGH